MTQAETPRERATSIAGRLSTMAHHEDLFSAIMQSYGEAIIVADDGNAEVEYSADDRSASEAAQEYVDSGDWGDRDETSWVTIYTWSRYRLGKLKLDLDDRDRHTVEIEPEEPECTESKHDWQSPVEIVGGIEDNPGVWGHGGGVIITECCMNCGCRRVTDTWAQNPETGVQGLTSVSYEPKSFAADLEALVLERAEYDVE